MRWHRGIAKAVQLHGRETAADTQKVAESFRWVIKVFSALDPNLPRADEYGTDMIMIDGPEPGSGKVFDWSLAGDAPDSLKLILAGGLTPDNVGAAITEADALAASGQTNWGTVIGIAIALLIGTAMLMSSLAFSFQRYFEYQIEAARQISQ